MMIGSRLAATTRKKVDPGEFKALPQTSSKECEKNTESK